VFGTADCGCEENSSTITVTIEIEGSIFPSY
jgi:hypothetical protein